MSFSIGFASVCIDWLINRSVELIIFLIFGQILFGVCVAAARTGVFAFYLNVLLVSPMCVCVCVCGHHSKENLFPFTAPTHLPVATFDTIPPPPLGPKPALSRNIHSIYRCVCEATSRRVCVFRLHRANPVFGAFFDPPPPRFL